MEKRFMQAAAMQIIYKGVFQWFLKLVVGVQFTDCQFLKKEKQFIILANHNSHLDTLSLLSSLPGGLLWKVKPVAAEDYFGKTRFQASISNFFINTLLIRRKGEKDSEHDPIRKMLEAIDAGYSLILFPEGTRGKPEQMGKIKSGIARILSLRPEVKYIPVFITGMGCSAPRKHCRTCADSITVPGASSCGWCVPLGWTGPGGSGCCSFVATVSRSMWPRARLFLRGWSNV